MTAHRLPIRRLILTGGFATAITVAPVLAGALSAADSFVAQPGCPPADTTAMDPGQCGPNPDVSIGPPSEQDLTECHDRNGDNGNCTSDRFYGPHEIPKPWTDINSSP